MARHAGKAASAFGVYAIERVVGTTELLARRSGDPRGEGVDAAPPCQSSGRGPYHRLWACREVPRGPSYMVGAASARHWPGCWTGCTRVGAPCWSCAARPVAASRRCSTSWSTARRVSVSHESSASSRRWNSRLPACTNSVRRCSIVSRSYCSGNIDKARLYLKQLESLAAATSGPFLCATLSYARPLLSPDDKADELYQAALSADLSNSPCYRGRLLLNYGRWLRHQRRVADSRAPLRAAWENFDALAFGGLAEAARQELRASGETSMPRTPDVRDHLTPQEMHIAQLAARGLSNREIGRRLYLSHRTIGSHLYRLFPKLGITSRSELAGVLSTAVPDEKG